MTYTTHTKIKKLYHLYLLIAIFAIAGVLGLSIMPVSHAAGGDTLYLSPASGSHTVGSTFTITIYENSYTDAINAVEADLTYPTAKLQYVAPAVLNSAWGVPVPVSGGGGSVKFGGGTFSPPTYTGLKTVGTVKFKVLASGSANVSFANTSALENNGVNYLSTMTGGTYTLVVATTPPPSPSPTPSPKPSPSPKPVTTTPKPTTSTTTTITPKNNTKGVTVPNNSQVEMNSPGTVSTTTAAGASTPVAKVEYYLNGKLVSTVTTAPFNYTVNTQNLLNGNYKLTTKTFYSDGTTDTKNTSLIVKNPINATQLKLQAQHYALYVIVLLALIAAGIWFLLRRNANKFLDMGPPTPPAAGQRPQPPAVNQQPPEAHVGVM